MSKQSLFWTVVLLHGFVWALLPTLLSPAYKPDVIELLFIGREWVWASAKHPMLPSWLLEMMSLPTGRCFAVPFVASQLCVIGTLVAVWAFARIVLPAPLAVVPPFVMLPYWFFTVESTKYNQNTVLVLLWTWSIFFVFRALQTNRLRYWIISGLVIGVGFHAKLTMIFLVASILLFMAFDARSRRYWKTPWPYLTTLIALLVFSPQLLWFLSHDVPGRQTAMGACDTSLLSRISYPIRFAASEFGDIFLPLLLLGPLLVFPWKRSEDSRQNGEPRWAMHYLTAMIGVPFVAHLLIAVALPLNLGADYGQAFWPFFAVWLLLRYKTKERPNFRHFGIFVGLCELLMITVFVIQVTLSPYLMGTPRGFHFPMQALGAKCDQIWEEQVGGPCPYVSGVWWFAGNAAQTMKPMPSVHAFGGTYSMDFDLPLSTWSTDDDVNRSGGLILWNAGSGTPKTLLTHFPNAEILPPFELNYQTLTPIPPLQIGIAIVRPTRPQKLE